MFTPIEATLGAVLIQLSTTNYYWQQGSTVGFSSAIFSAGYKCSAQGLQIVAGLISSSVFIKRWLPQFLPDFPQSALITRGVFSQVQLLCLAGFLVGVGTKLGNGCTSGHMICGISRLRLRSLVATGVFASVAMATVYFGALGDSLGDVPNYAVSWNVDLLQSHLIQLIMASSFFQVYLINPIISRCVKRSHASLEFFKWLNGIYSGFLFGLGLHIAGMVNVSKTIGFLALPTLEHFDPSLALIMLFAVVPNIFIWKSIKKPLLADTFNCANSTDITPKFLLGNALFGLGWGLLGVCPGPGLLNSLHFPQFLYWLGSFFSGQYLVTKLT
jgi:uncharacterized membrane protein YedE/YeeE